MPQKRTVLVTGGAGYIGAHACKLLAAHGWVPVTYDNLVMGHRDAVKWGPFEEGDLADADRLDQVMKQYAPEAVLHFAAFASVGESMRDPGKYYRNNVANALGLFELAARHGVSRIVFSSTAAVYGEPGAAILEESLPLAPVNPYGASKMMAERMLRDLAGATGVRYAILRYFNVAGADLEGRIGEATPDNSHLIKVACEAAIGIRPGMAINGVDYPTPDGTCVRDYIHVEDLAGAHIEALRYLERGGSSEIFNCGYGHGFSVREVIDTVARISGADMPIEEGPRRPGDPAVLVASNAKIREVLGWQPRYDDLAFIVQTAWDWEQKLRARRAEPARPQGS
jgi:UDP-glucose-4-epimerase GalE